MSHASDLIATDIHAYLAQHERKDMLRFLTCGNVDDGKSTLIGRLLHDSKLIYEDQLAAIRSDSARYNTTGGDDMDLALLVDGLQAEREQGITIDVAYRFFSTAKRKFIIADTPGHEQYTRNMATGASTCNLAIILIDARNGVQTQTRRHSFIASLLGIRHIVVAVNKMDAVNYSREVFEKIRADYESFAAKLHAARRLFIPISALKGDNVVNASANMPWYSGGTLMSILENEVIAGDRNLSDFRFPIQYVNRPHLDFRGYCGTIASGVIHAGDEVVVLPSGKINRVKSIVTFEEPVKEAFAPMSVTLTLEQEVDASRGDLLSHPDHRPHVGSRFEADLVWMNEEPLSPGKGYFLKHASQTINAKVSEVLHRVNVNRIENEQAARLELNEIGRVVVDLSQPVAFDEYRKNRAMGAFILIDRISHATLGAGMIVKPLTVSKARGGATVVVTGPAREALARALQKRGLILLEGWVKALKVKGNPRRIAELARLMNEWGRTVIVTAGPAQMENIRAVVGSDRLIHIRARKGDRAEVDATLKLLGGAGRA